MIEPGAYDIREFLKMEPADRAAYNEMRGKGMHHRKALKTLKER